MHLTYKEGKGKLRLSSGRGRALDRCASFDRKYICCNVMVLRSLSNCPFECSYCFLQNYLNEGETVSLSDTMSLVKEIREMTALKPRRLFRVGTWELGDSLALEYKTGQAAKLIREFAGIKNCILELKTKSDVVDTLLSVDHGGRSVVSWSLNPEYVIKKEEHRTAGLQRRLAAMQKVIDAGYPVAVHFDPMILYPRWKEGYEDLVKRVFEVAPPEGFAWISIGSLRFNREMRKTLENNYPNTNLTCAEMVVGDDGKMRYVKPLRVEMYKVVYEAIHKYGGSDSLVYLCMERWDVWERVTGYFPESAEELDYLFARSLFERFGMTEMKPQAGDYRR